MVDAWPADLPQCFNVPYSEGMADGRASVKPDVGPPIVRKRSTSAVRPLSGQMRMTRAQLAVLREFVDVTLDSGALPFTFPDPTTDGPDLLVMFPENELPAWMQTAAGVYQVSISLVVMP